MVQLIQPTKSTALPCTALPIKLVRNLFLQAVDDVFDLTDFAGQTQRLYTDIVTRWNTQQEVVKAGTWRRHEMETGASSGGGGGGQSYSVGVGRLRIWGKAEG